ncbi:MAG: chemotaxis protein CheB [Pyrinomonadaceae bacterium]|nr:chemotaxis protein CheB [Pyrinomonadaceae bacterium]
MNKLVVVGTSTGGLNALQALLPALPQKFSCAVVVVQHRGKEPGSRLREFLQRSSLLPISEPEDKEPILPGHVYLAPRDYHLLVEPGNFALSTEAPVYFARPSIDVLFESAADAYGENVVGVVLTGANGDGARGLARIKQAGGLTVVEEPTTAQAPEMPEAAIAATKVDRVLPLSEIGLFLNDLCHRDHEVN